MTAPLTQSGEADRRFKRVPLTPEQQSLVLSCADWVPKWVHVVLSKAAIRAFGYEDCVAESWAIVVRAAGLWRPEVGATFRYYAMNGVKKFLPVVVARGGLRNLGVWYEMPQWEGESGEEFLGDLLADDRGPPRDPLLAAWCDDGAREMRRDCFWIDRVVLYLRLVECWSLGEISGALGMSRERVRQLAARGVGAIEGRRLAAELRARGAGRAG